MKRRSDFINDYGDIKFVFSYYHNGDFGFSEVAFDGANRRITCVCRSRSFEETPLVPNRPYLFSELDPLFVEVRELDGVDEPTYYI